MNCVTRVFSRKEARNSAHTASRKKNGDQLILEIILSKLCYESKNCKESPCNSFGKS